MAHRRVFSPALLRSSAVIGLFVLLPLSAPPAHAGGFGGGGGHGGAGAGAGRFTGFVAGRVGPAGIRSGVAVPQRSDARERQLISSAGMNRQLILPSDPNLPRYGNFRGRYRQGFSRNNFIEGGYFKEGYSGTSRVSRDRYGNPYGSDLGFAYGGGSYGYGGYALQGYGQAGGIGAASLSYGEGEGASFPYAPPRIIEISGEGGRRIRSHAGYDGGGHQGSNGRKSAREPHLPIVTYGPDSASRASVGPTPGFIYAGSSELFSPTIVRVRVPKGG